MKKIFSMIKLLNILIVSFSLGCAPNKYSFQQLPLNSPTPFRLPSAVLYNQNLTVAGDSKAEPFKLLLVVDNSYSMSHAVSLLANGIDSLLAPLAGQNVEVKIITTTDAPKMTFSFDFYKADNSALTILPKTDNNIYNTPEYANSLYTKAVFTLTYGDQAGAGLFKLSFSDSKANFYNTIKKIKDYITNIGIGGSANSVEFCPIFRELDSNSFFKQGDQVAIVAITNADDHSSYLNCTKSNSQIFGPQSTVQRTTETYTYSVKAVRVHFNYSVLNDGVIINESTDGSALMDEKIVSEADLDANTCVNKATAYLRALPNSATIDLSNSKVSDCSLETVVTRNTRTVLNANEKFDCPQVAPALIGDSFFNYALDSNRKPSFIGSTRDITGVFDKSQACSKTTVTESSVERPYTNSSSTYFFQKSTPNPSLGDFQNQALIKATNMFSNNLFMHFIIEDNSCQLQSGESLGQSFISLASKNHGKVSTSPICESSYGKALSGVSNFAKQVIAATAYKMGLPTNAQVNEVNLISSSQTNKLDPSKYKIEGDHIQMFVNLKAGDTISIKYTN